MNTIKIFLSIIIIQIIICGSAFSQIAVINEIDYSAYPWLRATYTVKDAVPAEVRVSNAADIIIKEDGVVKPHRIGLSPYCPPPDQKTFSVILVIDASGSMYNQDMNGVSNQSPTKLDVVLDAMRNFVDNLDPIRNECAIIEFGGMARVVSGWSNNKDSLLKAIDKNNVYNLQLTDYNTAFLGYKGDNNIVDSSQSALYLIRQAKYKRVVVFLTDGSFNASRDKCIGKDPISGDPIFLTNAVVAKARAELTRIFCIHIGNELNALSTGYLTSLAQVEGNVGDNLRTNVTTSGELSGFYQQISDICGQIGYPAPCQVEWLSQCSPAGPRVVDLEFSNNYWNLTASKTFTVTDSYKPVLDIKARNISFLDVNPITTKDTIVVIKSLQNFTDVTGWGSTDSARFYVKNWGVKTVPFTLAKNESATITLTYAPKDSCYSGATVEILGTACSGRDITVDGTMPMFIPDVNCGDVTVNGSGETTVNVFFRNRTNKQINLQKINFLDGDKNDFTTSPSPLTGVLDPCQGINVKFVFSPKSNGLKTSTMELVTDAGKFTATITGNGMGTPGITSANPVIFPNANCASLTKDTVIDLKNTGPVPLTIDQTASVPQGPDNNDFIFGVIPPSIPANGSVPINITFAPKSAGNKLCTLLIKSNATNADKYYIEIHGTMDSVNYTAPNYDLGIVCLGTTKDFNFNLDNVGTKDLDVSIASKPTTYVTASPNWTITAAGNSNVQVSYTPTKEGPINDTIVFEETLCKIQRKVVLSGTVYDPRISNMVVTVTSNVGVKRDTTITITNPSVNDLYISGIAPQGSPSEFQFLSSVPNLPYAIPGGGTMQITLRYLPTSNVLAIDSLVLSGMPCHDVKLPLQGNPSLAQVEIFIEKYTGLVGQPVPIILKLRNGQKFDASNTATINTDISFDKTMLALLQPDSNISEDSLGNLRILHLKDIIVSSINVLQSIKTINLIATNSANTTTPITITNSVSDKKNVVFTPFDGEFTIVPAVATLQTKDYTAKPGDEISISIFQSNAQGLNAFHQGITTELRYNATLLEPIGDTKKGTVNTNGERIVPLDGIPINPNTGEVIVKSYKFKVMLGNAESTALHLQNSKVLAGLINFNDTIVGKMTVQICKDGGNRLFNPNNSPSALIIKPNPADAGVEVGYELVEDGLTTIWISDILGNQTQILVNEEKKSGAYSLNLDTRDLPAGVYFVIMQTPTQVVKKTLNILK